MPRKYEATEIKKEKQAAIFTAACRVFRKNGFHRARMADIAQEAGISYGLVYHYFKSKSDLFDALIEEWWQGLEKLTSAMTGALVPIKEKLGAVAEYFLDQYEQRPDLVHLFITEFSRATANLTPERLRRFKGLMDKTESFIKEAQEQGEVRRDLKARYLTYFFLGSLEALLSTMVLENQPLKSRDLKERLSRALITMFFEGARPAEDSGRSV